MNPSSNTHKKQIPGRAIPGAFANDKTEYATRTRKPLRPAFFSIRSFLLSLLLLCFLGAIRQVSSYKKFFAETIDEGYTKMGLIKDLDNYQDIETRKEMRWGYGYYWLVKIKAYLKDDSEAIVLLPPNDYIETINPAQALPEPTVAYYYTNGLKTSWGTTDYAYKCTYFYRPSKDVGPSVVPITRRTQIDTLLQLYKGYTYSY
jgi:hypothetical protein